MVVFYKATPTYNAQGLVRLETPLKVPGKKGEDSAYLINSLNKDTETFYTNFPRQTLYFKGQREGLHPTQKPVELFEYLIKTYTNPGEVVLDNCMGSGTTAVAALNTGRKFIGFEKEAKYYEIALERIKII